MTETVFKIVVGYITVIMSWVYMQISEAMGGIVDKGFDAGLSIGLLIVGLIILGWYHWKYQQYSRDLISNLSKQKNDQIEKLHDEKDERTEKIHVLALQQIDLTKDQIQTNRELRDAVHKLSEKIQDGHR